MVSALRGGGEEMLDDGPICGLCDPDADEREVLVGEEAQQCEEIQASMEEEQSEAVASLPTPEKPTLSEYLDHCTTHYPYRSWCRHCVEGRG